MTNTPHSPHADPSRLAAMPTAHRVILLAVLFAVTSAATRAAEPGRPIPNIAYKATPSTDYERERCKLDLYLPANVASFPTVVWFHGGNIEGGDKAGDIAPKIAARLNAHGIAVASVNYRLSPKAHFPAYLEDAAASVAWTIQHIAEHGGSSKAVFVSGHSAGGYLTAMIGMDPSYLAAHSLTPDDLAGCIPVAGQMVTHSTVRNERGIPRTTPIIDAGAPVYFARSNTPPFLNICADNDLPARVEENTYFAAALKAAGNERVRALQILNRDHGSVAAHIADDDDPALQAILQFIETHRP